MYFPKDGTNLFVLNTLKRSIVKSISMEINANQEVTIMKSLLIQEQLDMK